MRRLAALAATALAVAAPVLVLTTAAAHAGGDGNDGNVCLVLDSGKVDTKGDPQSVTVYAPAGKVITGYCVKAGSTHQGNGPVYVTLEQPTSALAIRHPSGKAVSHYSLTYGSATTTPTQPTQPTTPTQPTEPTQPTTPTQPTQPTTPAQPTTPTEPVVVPPVTNAPAVDAHGNFDWNWTYAPPTCDALTVAYPSNLPDGQANDVNIRLRTAAGDVTLNYHLDQGTWSGTHGFTYSQHPRWPAGVTDYTVVWTQVGGSNYHFRQSFHNAPVAEPVRCRIAADGNPATLDVPLAVSSIAGWRTAPLAVAVGRAASADVVTLVQPGLEVATLQRLTDAGRWVAVKKVTAAGAATKVTFPQETRKGTSRYRLVLPRSESVTGTTSKVFTVRVR